MRKRDGKDSCKFLLIPSSLEVSVDPNEMMVLVVVGRASVLEES